MHTTLLSRSSAARRREGSNPSHAFSICETALGTQHGVLDSPPQGYQSKGANSVKSHQDDEGAGEKDLRETEVYLVHPGWKKAAKGTACYCLHLCNWKLELSEHDPSLRCTVIAQNNRQPNTKIAAREIPVT